MTGRRTTNKDQGGDDGGRSQDGDRRGRMALDNRGPTNGGRSGGGGARGGEPMSPGEAEDPEGQGRAEGSGDRGGDPRSAAELERLRTQVELEAGRNPTEPVGQSDKAQPEERSPEAMVRQRLTKAPGGAGGPTGDVGDKGARIRE